MQLIAWIKAARLRTLPLALATFGTGAAFAYHAGYYDERIFGLGVMTTLLLQVLSNFANDLGDYHHGADTEDRVGPQRMTQSGRISPRGMKMGVVLTALMAFCSGLALIWVSFLPDAPLFFFGFLGLGLLAILAAYAYTAGMLPYGYQGLGDFSVFLFFGLLGVLGSYFLFARSLALPPMLAAVGVGALSTAVLNQNNMRDLDSDKKAGKMTLAVRLGLKGAKIYQAILFFVGVNALLSATIRLGTAYAHWLVAFPCLSLLLLLIPIWKREGAALDPFLRLIALHTFLIAVLMWVGILI